MVSMDLFYLVKPDLWKANTSTNVLLSPLFFSSSLVVTGLNFVLIKSVSNQLVIELISNQGSVPWRVTIPCSAGLSVAQLITTENNSP